MDLFKILKTKNTKIKKITGFGIKLCFILSLVATLILEFYKSTYILFQYFLGITILKVSIVFFTSFIICYLAFIRITDDLD